MVHLCNFTSEDIITSIMQKTDGVYYDDILNVLKDLYYMNKHVIEQLFLKEINDKYYNSINNNEAAADSSISYAVTLPECLVEEIDKSKQECNYGTFLFNTKDDALTAQSMLAEAIKMLISDDLMY